MGERGHAVASLWLGHAPSIGLAIGSRQYPDEMNYYSRNVSLGVFQLLHRRYFCRRIRTIWWKTTTEYDLDRIKSAHLVV